MAGNWVRVLCVNKTDRMDPHDRIRNIGGQNDDQSVWKMSQPDAIAAIKAGTYRFYVQAGGSSVAVIVAVSQYGNEYLKTEADGEQPDNLLSLPECV